MTQTDSHAVAEQRPAPVHGAGPETTDPRAVASPLPEPGAAGISLFAVVALLLGLKLVHAIPQTSTLALIPVLIFCGLGQVMLAPIAMRSGEHVIGLFFCVFGPFLVSFGALVLGLVHNWWPVPPTDIAHVEGAFIIGWTAIVTLFLLLSPVISPAFGLLLVTLDAALWFFAYSIWNTSDGAGRVAGWFLLVAFVGSAYYIASRWLAWAGFDVLPLGRPLMRPRPTR
jgi:uncharacterized protein